MSSGLPPTKVSCCWKIIATATPLTVTDHASRYLLTCEALSSTKEVFAFTIFERLRLAYAGCAAPRRCAGCACEGIRCSLAYGSRKSHRFHHRSRRATRSGRREDRRGEDRNDAHLRYGGRAIMVELV